uniref:uncharacterized protein LOC122606280 n=1 Tax=Erigeron canadensis TaxID=72917 RepID=UPI001CB8913A|nr:uncharacterized protein LOC122606280 [Erigeron canadensis]
MSDFPTQASEKFKELSEEIAKKQDKLFKDLGECLNLTAQIRDDHQGLILEAIGRWGDDMVTLREELVDAYENLDVVQEELRKAKGNAFILQSVVSKFKRIHPEIDETNGN